MTPRSGDIRRVRRAKSERRRVLVLCEGMVTEVQYFQGLAQAVLKGHADSPVLVVKGIGRDPAAVVSRAIKELAEKAYDEIWAIVDVDEHARLSEAAALAAQRGVHLAISNPCFELWLLWHYEDQTAHIERGPLARRLVSYGHDGKHLPATFPFSEARRASSRAESTDPGVCVVGSNPSTAVGGFISTLGI